MGTWIITQHKLLQEFKDPKQVLSIQKNQIMQTQAICVKLNTWRHNTNSLIQKALSMHQVVMGNLW